MLDLLTNHLLKYVHNTNCAFIVQCFENVPLASYFTKIIFENALTRDIFLDLCK